MCAPAAFAIAQIAISAASGAAQYSASQAQYAAKERVYEANVVNSLAAARDDQQRLTLRSMQEEAAYHQKDHAQLVMAAERQAEVNVSAAGGNVAGISIGNLVGDVIRRTDANRTALQTNWMNTAQQLQAEQEGAVTKAKSRIGQVAEPTEPSPIGSILGVAGTAISSFSKLDIVSTGGQSQSGGTNYDSITTAPTDFGFGRTP